MSRFSRSLTLAIATSILISPALATRALASASAPAGWTNEKVINPNTDDWEPAIATDPHSPYVYMITTRYGQPKTCSSHCPTPYIAMTISSDGGKTWGAQVPLCVCRGSGAQYDPTIKVVPNTGVVDAVFLNADRAGGFSTVFITSHDHGQTWTAPVHVYKNSWTDKPFFTTDPSGRNVYVSWNGQAGGDPHMGVSHDHGATWTSTRIVDSKRYFYAYDASYLPDGTVVFAESSETYSGSTKLSGKVWHHAFILPPGKNAAVASDWLNVVVDKVPVGEPCVAAGCSPDYYTGQASVAVDPSGHLVFAYEGPKTALGPQRVYVKTSNDDGRTWSAREALSVSGENATQPRLASGGGGNFRIWYMQTAGGDNPNAWNVWYRSSDNAGSTWSSPVKLSNAPAGTAGYINSRGFDEIYGDYGEIGITNTGRTIAVWGEGYSWNGPGRCWFARQI
jgi:hypothetical protein